MGGGETTVSSPPPPAAPSPLETTREAIQAQVQSMPEILRAQQEFGPQFSQLSLEQLQQYGPQFTEQLLGLQEQFGPRVGEALRAEQEATQPELGAAREKLTGFLGEAGGVSPEEAALFKPEAGAARQEGIAKLGDIAAGREGAIDPGFGGVGQDELQRIATGGEGAISPEFSGIGREALEQFVGQEATFSPRELAALQQDIRGAQGVRGFGLVSGAGAEAEASIISQQRRERELQRQQVAAQLAGLETGEGQFGAGLEEAALARRAQAAQSTAGLTSEEQRFSAGLQDTALNRQAQAAQAATTLPDELKQLLELQKGLQTQRLNIALSTSGRAPVQGISQTQQQPGAAGPGQLIQNVTPGQIFGLASSNFGTQASIFGTQAGMGIAEMNAANTLRGQNVSMVNSGMSMLSSKEYKDNIEPIENALDVISKIEGVKFNWKETQAIDGGVIAEQLEEVLPNAVVEIDGKKHVKPMMIIGYLIEAVKELSAQRGA